MSRGNTHRNRFKWLNNPTQGTKYNKEFVEQETPQIEVCFSSCLTKVKYLPEKYREEFFKLKFSL
jgi:hypothetical protein